MREPVMSAEEWVAGEPAGKMLWYVDLGLGVIDVRLDTERDRLALAAQLLGDFFTWKDVALIREAIIPWGAGTPVADALRDLADRLAALLPPTP